MLFEAFCRKYWERLRLPLHHTHTATGSPARNKNDFNSSCWFVLPLHEIKSVSEKKNPYRLVAKKTDRPPALRLQFYILLNKPVWGFALLLSGNWGQGRRKWSVQHLERESTMMWVFYAKGSSRQSTDRLHISPSLWAFVAFCGIFCIRVSSRLLVSDAADVFALSQKVYQKISHLKRIRWTIRSPHWNKTDK